MIEISGWKDIYNRLDVSLKESSFVYAVFTDELYIRNINDERLQNIDTDKLLEIRVFKESGEFRLIRPNIGQDFYERQSLDEGVDDNSYDIEAYLDISDNRNEGNYAASINGGKYELPQGKVEAGKMLKIRNYLTYDEETGQARVYDWRLVEFTEE